MTGSLAGAWGVAVMVALAALLLLHRPLGRLLRLAACAPLWGWQRWPC